HDRRCRHLAPAAGALRRRQPCTAAVPAQKDPSPRTDVEDRGRPARPPTLSPRPPGREPALPEAASGATVCGGTGNPATGTGRAWTRARLVRFPRWTTRLTRSPSLAVTSALSFATASMTTCS